jgi:hypothetical protein
VLHQAGKPASAYNDAIVSYYYTIENASIALGGFGDTSLADASQRIERSGGNIILSRMAS